MQLDHASQFDHKHHHDHHHHGEPTSYVQTNLVSDGSVPAKTTDPNLINPWGIRPQRHQPVLDFRQRQRRHHDLRRRRRAADDRRQYRDHDRHPARPDRARQPDRAGVQRHRRRIRHLAERPVGIVGVPVRDRGRHDLRLEPQGERRQLRAGGRQLQGRRRRRLQGPGHRARRRQIAMLYAANFRDGTVDVFDTQFHQVNAFTDPNLPAGYAPFNVQDLNGELFVDLRAAGRRQARRRRRRGPRLRRRVRPERPPDRAASRRAAR